MKVKTFFIIIILLLTLTSCQKESEERDNSSEKTAEKVDQKVESEEKKEATLSYEIYRYVSAQAGLRMRDKPDLDGEKLGVIPYNTKVKMLQITGDKMFIAGETGYWTEVDYNGSRGWVFGGFLSPTINGWFEKLSLKDRLVGHWGSGGHWTGIYFNFYDYSACSIIYDGTEGSASGTYTFDPHYQNLVITLHGEGRSGETYTIKNEYYVDKVEQYGIMLGERDKESYKLNKIVQGRAETPLHEAIEANDYAEVERLIDYWDLNYLYAGTGPVLFTAARKGSKEIVELLIKRGADIEMKGFDNTTALHHASDKPENIEVLLKYGADINAPKSDLATPIFYAIYSIELESIKTYIKYGFDPTVENERGQTPLDMAKDVAARDMTVEAKERAGVIVRLLADYRVEWNENKVKPYTAPNRPLLYKHEEQLPTYLSSCTEKLDDSRGETGWNSSIAVDSKDALHISYFNRTQRELMYMTNAGGNWEKTILDATEDSSPGYDSSLAIDSSDKVHISYSDWKKDDLKYITNAGGSWEIITIDASGDVGYGSSLAVDGDSFIHISYIGDRDELKYATNRSGEWITAVVDADVAIRGKTAIGIDSKNGVHIAYGEYGELKYASNSSGEWAVSELAEDDIKIDLSYSTHLSLAVAPDDGVHISYYAENTTYNEVGALRYVTNSSGRWEYTTVVSNSNSGLYNSLAIDSKGKIHISYFERTAVIGRDELGLLYYATNVGGPWVYKMIQDRGNYGKYTSIAINSKQEVSISFFHLYEEALNYAAFPLSPHFIK